METPGFGQTFQNMIMRMPTAQTLDNAFCRAAIILDWGGPHLTAQTVMNTLIYASWEIRDLK